MREILLYNYWEHVKLEKDLARVLPPSHPRRVAMNESINKLSNLLNSEQNDEWSAATDDRQRTKDG